MINKTRNLILKMAIVSWLLIIILILIIFISSQLLNSNSKLQIDTMNIDQLIENNICNLAKEIKIKSLDSIGTATLEPTAPEYFYYLSDYEQWLVESIVAGEAGIEPYEGKVAVASCILNACLLEDKRPEEIQTMYGYAGWKPIEEFESECMEAYGNTDLADEVRDAVSQVFDRGEVLSNEILWFYNPNIVYSSWHENQKYVGTIGSHKFFAPL